MNNLYVCQHGRIFGAEHSGDIGVDPDFLPTRDCNGKCDSIRTKNHRKEKIDAVRVE